MRKNTYKLIIIISALATMLVSCTKETELVTLQTSTEQLNFSKDPGEQYVDITTNSRDWNAFSEVDWVITQAEESRLKVRVQENNEPLSRSAQIIVRANGVSKKITVEQSAASASLTLSSSSYSLSYLGGDSEVYLSTNNKKNWRAESNADWIELKEDKNKNRVLFSIARNTTLEDRQAVIQFYIDDKQLEEKFTIDQEALPELILPYGKWGVDDTTIRLFEERRGNYVHRIPDGFLFHDWGYKTPSPTYDYIEYSSTARGTHKARLYASKTHAPNAFNSEDKKKVEEFLLAAGFEKDDEKDEVYINPERKTKAQLLRVHSGIITYPCIEYELYAVQDKEYPTLSLDDFLGVFRNYNREPIYIPAQEEFEKEKNSKYDPSKSSSTRWFYHAEYPWLYRFYDLSGNNDGRITNYLAGFEDISVVYFQDEVGNYFLTKEFKELMEKSDFKLVDSRPSRNRYKFLNITRNISIVVSIGATNFTGGRQLLLTQVDPV